LAIDFFRKIFGSANIDPPRRSRRMQGLPPEDPEVSQPLLPNPPEDSPQQSEIQDHIPSQAERTDSLESFRIVSDSLDAFRLPPGYERRILRLNSSGELVVDTSGIPTESLLALKTRILFGPLTYLELRLLDGTLPAQRQKLRYLSFLNHPKHLLHLRYL
jgi:hypothetical protein